MSMRLIMLGSGTGIPLSFRASPSLVLFVEGDPVIFDMGPGTLRRLSLAGLNWERISRIFITHFHPDHTADLIHLMFATRNPSVMARKEPFTITGPQGLKGFIRGIQQAYDPWLALPPEIMGIEELDVGRRVEKIYPKFKIIVSPARHTQHSLAYRVESRTGKSIVYSGDTEFCEEIVDLAEGADLLVLECSFPDGSGVEGHLTPTEAGRLAHLAGVKRLVLTHFYPEVLNTDIASRCRRVFQGELILARDLLHVNV